MLKSVSIFSNYSEKDNEYKYRNIDWYPNAIDVHLGTSLVEHGAGTGA